MNQKNLKKGAWAAGGAALLAVTSVLCIKGMEAVGRRLKAKEKKEVAEADLFEESVETVAEEETAEEETNE